MTFRTTTKGREFIKLLWIYMNTFLDLEDEPDNHGYKVQFRRAERNIMHWINENMEIKENG